MHSDPDSNPYLASTTLDNKPSVAMLPKHGLPKSVVIVLAMLIGLATFAVAWFADILLNASPLWNLEAVFFFAVATSCATSAIFTLTLNQAIAWWPDRRLLFVAFGLGITFFFVTVAIWVVTWLR